MRASDYAILLAVLSGLVALTFVGSLLIGPSDLGMAGSLEGLFSTETSLAQLVMYEIRLPRAVLGLMIGVTLGLSGAVLQGFVRNPLAEPGSLGISSAAALGAVLVVYHRHSVCFSSV